jgi:hypothetical protein
MDDIKAFLSIHHRKEGVMKGAVTKCGHEVGRLEIIVDASGELLLKHTGTVLEMYYLKKQILIVSLKSRSNYIEERIRSFFRMKRVDSHHRI